MNTVDHPPSSATDGLYYTENDHLGGSPLLKPMNPNLLPSPSPEPAVPLYAFIPSSYLSLSLFPDYPANTGRPQLSPDSSPGPESSEKRKPKNKPSQGDAILVSIMDGGRRPDIARDAGTQALASDDESEEGSIKGTVVNFDPNLAAIATSALAAEESTSQEPAEPAKDAVKYEEPSAEAQRPDVGEGDAMEGVKPTLPSMTAALTPESHGDSPPEGIIKLEKPATTLGELPPIRHSSPQSAHPNGNGAGPINLPSISESIGDLNNIAKSTSTPTESTFSQSPPIRPTLQFPLMNHGSPPKSPNDVFSARRELPSPAGGPGPGHPYYINSSSHRRYSTADTPQYSSASEYNSNSTETPSTDQSASTPSMGIDRMSIDGITNPQIGGFQCTFNGCTAQPFQTQVSSLPD